MTVKKPTRAKRTAARRKKTATRTPLTKTPKGGPIGARIGTWMALRLAREYQRHQTTTMSRRDAAILRITHEGCPRCKGNGQIFTKGKDGSFTGSKPCTAKPTRAKAGRMRVAIASRFGADKSSGLVGWTCPCGKKEKPRFRDAKEATKALRTHERQKHGGKTVGGAWYAQTTAPDTAPTEQPKPVSKVVTDSGLTDDQWIKKNKSMAPAKAIAKGYCWQCAGNGTLYSAFGGQQLAVACDECQGSGKARVSA
ncbi:hypothetical protein QMZ92_16445 [Streptomyces sp. HNM0645]|uniref:hypothetical protein n=1 Tax=Streptomyces sp. HNM0645 TaxID=2782343 RepID=UPI0024B841F1|nr:hypothetical protein [Streptomyces sp. HNM0645]MDI9885925.1 hypothetical protein [Streptomyces sp. HNM0645]